MKFVYVVCSTEKDYYLEQAILSMHSLKIYNPTAEIILLTDSITVSTLINGRERVKKYTDDIISLDIPIEFTSVKKSRFLKTSMRKWIQGDFLFIDTDTIICQDLKDLQLLEGEIWAALDLHQPIDRSISELDIRFLAKKIGWNIPANGYYFNSGVMWIKDTPQVHALFEDWHKFWNDGVKRLNINADQPMLALANAKNHYIIKELPGEYNCQIVYNGLKYLYNAKIIHYFASSLDSKWSSPYLFKDKNLYSIIRTKGITEEIDKRINNAYSEFCDLALIIGGEASIIYSSPLVSIARRLSLKFPIINRILYKILKLK